MDDYTPNPRIVGTTEIPASKPKRTPTGGKRGPGRFYLHGGDRSSFARQVLDSLAPGRAAVIEFDDAETLQHYAVLLHNVNKFSKSRAHTPVRTRSSGLRLTVWLREDDAQLRML